MEIEQKKIHKENANAQCITFINISPWICNGLELEAREQQKCDEILIRLKRSRTQKIGSTSNCVVNLYFNGSLYFAY